MQDFLPFHAQECLQYDCSTAAERIAFAGSFLERIADTRNLMCAAVHLAQNGDKAAGPNGQRLARLLQDRPAFVWQELRRLAREIRDGSYRPGPVRREDIPKSSGQGTRPIEIANWQDQVVQRAILQILEPFVDYQFDELSLGYRSGHDRFEAIARAKALIEQEGRTMLVCADLREAFTRIPHRPLLEELDRRFGNEQVTALIRRVVVANNRRRGVPQGGALSPFLLNLYLDRHLDQPWRRLFPDVPMIRVADDLLFLCRPDMDPEALLAALRRILQPTGMSLQESSAKSKTQIGRLAAGGRVEWLGIAVHLRDGRIRFSLSEKFYDKLSRKLREAMAKPDGALRAVATVRGVFDQLGPCYASAHHDEVFCQLASLAEAAGTQELPTRGELLTIWQQSATRFAVQCKLWRLVYLTLQNVLPTTGTGSATCQVFPAQSTPVGRGDGQPVAPVSSISFTMPTATLTIACILPAHSNGAWAYHVSLPGQRRTSTKCEVSKGSHRLRPALKAALTGIRLIPPNFAVRIVTNSDYLCGDWRRYVDECRRRGGKTADDKVPANWDLLDKLDREVAWREVVIEYRRSTTSIVQNDDVGESLTNMLGQEEPSSQPPPGQLQTPNRDSGRSNEAQQSGVGGLECPF